jgi:hypothetical protein
MLNPGNFQQATPIPYLKKLITMKKEEESRSKKAVSHDGNEKPTRKGLHRYFHVSKLDWYISAVIAFTFAVLGVIELFGISNLRFIKMGNSFQFAMLFAIFGMVARIYYKMFEEQYEKGK